MPLDRLTPVLRDHVKGLEQKGTAKGAETAPDTPTSAKSAIAVCDMWNSGPSRSKGLAVQNRQKAPNKKAW